MGSVRRGPKRSDQMDGSGPELIERAPVRAEKFPKKAAAPLVTWTGQANAPALYPAGNELTTRLHLLLVDYQTGIGLVVAGWFFDPTSAVAAVSFDVGMNDTLDLVAEAMLLTDRRHLQGFDVPKDMAVKFGFVLLVPEGSRAKLDGLNLRLHMAQGETYDHFVPQVEDFSHLADVIAFAPVDYGLQIMQRLFTAWRATEGRSQHLPEQLEVLAGQIHQRIDPQRDYATQLIRPSATGHVDVAIRAGDMGMLVAGWLMPDYPDTVKEVALVSLFGRRAVLGSPLPTKSRSDVLQAHHTALAQINCGYAAFATIEGLDQLDALWFLEIVMSRGSIRRVPFVCLPEPTPLNGIEAAVQLAEEKDANFSELYERAISPAVEWFWAQTRRPGAVPKEMVYGNPPPHSRVSVIVPVYGRLDFVRHQIAHFSNDPEFRAESGTVDLIYVLDDPTKANEFSRLCRFLHDVYGVPFRILVQSENQGYSAANNAGAGISRGDLLLLLNSDVFPTAPRWVGNLARTYNTLDRCGVLGCRLLFEDGSIQHAGMSFRQSRTAHGLWENDHPGRGLSVPFDTHAVPEAVPAVTGACLLIDRKLFNMLGGMSEDYVIGDFEDSDLCLRVRQHGLKIYYTPDVELYHLERQSMRLIGHGSAWWRQSLTLYNMWKHTRRWGALIPQVLDEFVPRPPSEKTENGLPVQPGPAPTVGTDQRLALTPQRRQKNRRIGVAGKRPG